MFYIYTVFHLASDLFYCLSKSDDRPAVSLPDSVSLQCPFRRRKNAWRGRETVAGKVLFFLRLCEQSKGVA